MMQSRWQVGPLVLGLVLVAGCVENRASVVIKGNLVPDDSCSVSGGSEDYRSMGVLDLSDFAFQSSAPQYFMYPRVVNNLLSTEAEGEVELNYIELVEARMDLDLGALGGVVEEGPGMTRFRYPAFVTLAPGESAGIPVLAIPHEAAINMGQAVRAMGAMPIVRVRLKFLYQHGEYEHETHEVEFPIQLCNGCLMKDLGDCASGSIPDQIATGNACNPTQDTPVDCCTFNGEYLCPAVDMTVEDPQ